MLAQPAMSLVLHAHLPFVRHPEYDAFLEENWLFEAITESYLPLLNILRRLDVAKVPGTLTLTLTPPLCEMLCDEMLLMRYLRRLKDLCELADKEIQRTKIQDQRFHDAALHYHQRFNDMRVFYTEDIGGEFIKTFRKHLESGRLEILCCAATHALLPLLESPDAVRAQIRQGVINYRKHFQRSPKGFWIPECACTPEIDRILYEEGIEYYITDAHAILHGVPLPKYGVYAPVITPYGSAAFARDPESSRQVWSAQTGYPGDPLYREFYRDLGWDAPLEQIGNYLVAHDLRHDLGIKYHRITGDVALADKEAYNPAAAQGRAAEHAGHFIASRLEHAADFTGKTGRQPLFVAPYDAELFGHWWYEGPAFIEELFRQAANKDLQIISPTQYLQVTPHEQIQPQTPCVSSWGYNGYFENWLNGSNDWIYPPLHSAGTEMRELIDKFPAAEGIIRRALNQAGRELLLAQSSDWPFILSTNTMAPYARRRVVAHLEHFEALHSMLEAGEIDENYLHSLEERNNIFSELDYHIFAAADTK